MSSLDPDLVDRYLTRLGLEREPPSADALARIHRRQVERIPWETVWIHEGRAWDIDPATSAHRITTTGRGGYCFHLNGALGALLDALGYRVTRHRGGVHGPDEEGAALLDNHLVLGVHDLPTDACPGGLWYVDTGLGDALHAPVAWRAGPIRQPPFTLALEEVGPDGMGDWHLVHGRHGAFGGMSFAAATTTVDAFAEHHRWLSTSPESGFVRLLVAQRRTATTSEGLRGLVHAVVSDDGVATTVVDDRSDWLDLLADGFGIVPDDATTLWDRTSRAHEAWAARD